MNFGTCILSAASAFPERIMENKEFEAFVDTNDEWIKTRTGIQTRRVANPAKGESTVSFAAEAGKKALERAGLQAKDLDLIVVGTVTPDTVMPCVANQVQARLGATRAFSFDLQAACSGWMYGASIADQYIRSGMVQNALVIGAETLTSILNWRDRTTCVLFGDGAGATILSRTEDAKRRILATRLFSDGKLGELLSIPHGYSKVPPHSAEYRSEMAKITMNGKEIFKHAVRNMIEASDTVLASQQLQRSDVDFFIFHQANTRIIEMCMKSLGVTEDKTWKNIHKYGNISSATLPICLEEAMAAGKLGPGKLVLMSTFGGGLTWGSLLVRL